MAKYILALDQGTTSSKALIFNHKMQPISSHQIPIKQYYPHNGWVEHDPLELLESTINSAKLAISKSKISPQKITSIGIANQRETTIIWNKKTGKPIHNAIVWQDRRTSKLCEKLSANVKFTKILTDKTGLLLDPYFSATKINWLLDNYDKDRKRAKNNELAFGTVDSFLLWHLTNGKIHATDATNASRTLIFNIKTQEWDEELLQAFNIPKNILPDVLDSNALFGTTNIFGDDIPITGIAGDQQAATVGQACLNPGMIKSTYGTGCFLLLNTGKKIVKSTHKLLSTIAYRISGEVTYGLEGSIFSAGSTIQWLTDTLKLIKTPAESEKLAAGIKDNGGVYFVPAFTGLGAPHWQPDARAAISGITRNTGAAHISRAALEAVCYQTNDLLNAMQSDFQRPFDTLRVDGGMVSNNWLLQFLSDVTNLPVKKPYCIQTTAIGAALLSGLGSGLFSSLEEITKNHQIETSFHPIMTQDKRQILCQNWDKAINKVY